MDNYNRGAGFRLSGNQIGTAIIIREDTSSVANAAGFYAAAYETQFGTVISYRGTDNPISLPNLNPWSIDPGSDISNGWILGAGDYSANQAFLASKFLASVTAEPHKGDILLTGHSVFRRCALFASIISALGGLSFYPFFAGFFVRFMFLSASPAPKPFPAFRPLEPDGAFRALAGIRHPENHKHLDYQIYSGKDFLMYGHNDKF